MLPPGADGQDGARSVDRHRPREYAPRSYGREHKVESLQRVGRMMSVISMGKNPMSTNMTTLNVAE